MNSIFVVDQFRFFTTYNQWNELSSVSKCYVTDICVPSFDINKTPIYVLHDQYKLKIWIMIACPNELVLKYITKNIPVVTGFLFRTDNLHVPGQWFELFNTTTTLKRQLPKHIQVGWSFQWHHYPFSPKHFGWKKKNELSRPFLPPIENVLDICLINWQRTLKPHQLQTYIKRLINLRIPSHIMIVPYLPEKPIDLSEKNVGGITTQHLEIRSLPYFFPLENPTWLEPPKSVKKSINKIK
jgi:hypothetical protein